MMGPMSSATSYSDVLRLPPGPVDLRSIETDAAPGYDGDKKSGAADLAALGPELADLQERLFAAKDVGGGRCCSSSRAWTPPARAAPSSTPSGWSTRRA